jgi:NCAIR mutase (PurE)-related protein
MIILGFFFICKEDSNIHIFVGLVKIGRRKAMTFDELFDQIRAGKLDRKSAQKHFSLDWLETASSYIADVNRGARINIPEIIYGEYKTQAQTVEVADALLQRHPRVIVSRSPHNNELEAHYSKRYPVINSDLVLVVGEFPEPKGTVLVISAGAADHPVVEECAITLRSIGVRPLVFEDRGIAHPTRVLDAVKEGISNDASAVVVVAGMEGALAPFVASLVSLPVIGVPTSVGYGFRAKEAALTSMLASCAPNLTVVNIDGIRGAVVSGFIARNREN